MDGRKQGDRRKNRHTDRKGADIRTDEQNRIQMNVDKIRILDKNELPLVLTRNINLSYLCLTISFLIPFLSP